MIKRKDFQQANKKTEFDECAYKPSEMKEEYYLSLLPPLESKGKRNVRIQTEKRRKKRIWKIRKKIL
jgi:hypothetical protein